MYSADMVSDSMLIIIGTKRFLLKPIGGTIPHTPNKEGGGFLYISLSSIKLFSKNFSKKILQFL